MVAESIRDNTHIHNNNNWLTMYIIIIRLTKTRDVELCSHSWMDCLREVESPAEIKSREVGLD